MLRICEMHRIMNFSPRIRLFPISEKSTTAHFFGGIEEVFLPLPNIRKPLEIPA